MRRLTWAFVTLFSSGALWATQAGQKATAVGSKPDLTELKKLHYAASLAVAEGDKSLDDPLPSQMKKNFAFHMTAQEGKSASTYRELIVRSEDDIVQFGSRVTVSVDAKPHSCNVPTGQSQAVAPWILASRSTKSCGAQNVRIYLQLRVAAKTPQDR